MKRILSLILATLMLVCLFAACSEAPDGGKDDIKIIEESGKLKVGITYFAPMNYMDADGKLIGFETEFAEAVCEKLGVDAEFIEINWDSKELDLNSGKIDCIWNGMTITPERAENMSISVPYMKNKQVMVVRAENADKYLESVEGAKISAEAGSAGETVANEDEFLNKGTYLTAESMATALLNVKSGNADIAVVDYITALGSIGEGTDYADLVVVESLSFGEDEEYGIAFRKDSNLTSKVNEIIAELMADGTVDAIAETYKLADYIIK